MLLFLFQARRRERDRDSRLGPEGRFTFSVRKHLYRRLMATAKDVDVSSPQRRVAAIGSLKERRRDPLFFLKKDPVYLHFPVQGAQMEFKMKMVH